MNRLGALLIALVLAAPAARASELTRIASSFDEDHPFGLFLDLSFQRTQEKGTITRAHYQNGGLTDVNELGYTGTDSRLKIDARFGLWKDLEFHFGLPIVFARNESWDFAEGTNSGNSTITNNCLDARGNPLDPNCPTTGAGAAPLFPVPGNTYRGGLGDMEFGLAYAFFNQKRDDTKPTWIVGLDYEAPTAEKLDPSVVTSKDSRGKIGDRVHKYTLYTSFSRKLGALEPYFKFSWMIPVNGPHWYSNCDNPSPSNMSHPENCGVGPWTRSETGMSYPHEVGLLFGAEAVPFHDATGKQKVTVDLRAIGNYIGPGRYYNELSGLFLKLMHSDDYLQLGGRLGVTAQATEFITFKLHTSVLYNTNHTLSSESMGQDLNGNGKIDVTGNTQEVNPNFDFRSDLSTREFRMTANTLWAFDLMVSFNF